uniref:Ddb1 and cul4 associated factor 11 n=1 Tax=Nothobranchius rachovii TaxID=451742 RepID=A0A1A8NAC8_9TELE
MSCGRGSSSDNPAGQSEGAEPNQSSSSNRGRRSADRQLGDRQSASEEDVDLAEVLAYLLRRGQVRLVHGSEATGLQLVQSYSDSDEDSDGAWDGRLGDRYNPPVDSQPDTHEVDHSEIRTQILLATASSSLKGRHSFTHMLTEREQGSFLPNYVSHKDSYLQKAFCGVYSEDGNMFLSACQDQNIRLYDTSRGRFNLQRTIDAHEDDVNAVAFADSSSQLLFSGSDDAVCKVWDRRSLREDRPQAVGQLAGHRDGITFIHSKGDARYLISNSKDQSIKLWDIRKFSPKEGLAASRLAVTQQNWDYRWQQVPQRALKRHKLTGDTSVMTYRGHGVLHTLIRCRFSPEFSTGQRYIYSGCSTGKIIIYDVLTGVVVSRLSGHDACVRDVSWHPYEDKIISSSWDGAVRMWEHRQTHPLEEERERDKD